MGVRGGLGETPGALRETILDEKVVWGNVMFYSGFAYLAGSSGRPKIAPCSSGAVRDVPRRLRNVLRGKGEVEKIQKFTKMHQAFEFCGEEYKFSCKILLFGAATSPEFIVFLR